MSPHARQLADRLAADLRTVVAERLRSVVVYGPHAGDDGAGGDRAVHALALVRGLGFPDLEALARLVPAWSRAGLATPLVIDESEFARSFDAFPIEFGAIVARYERVTGDDPFDGLRVDPADLRRACEVQVRSHLLHLREGFLETGGDPGAIGALVANSAAPLVTLLANLARLAGEPAAQPEALAALADRWTGSTSAVFHDVVAPTGTGVPAADAARLFPAYLAGVERLTAYVDRWSREG